MQNSPNVCPRAKWQRRVAHMVAGVEPRQQQREHIRARLIAVQNEQDQLQLDLAALYHGGQSPLPWQRLAGQDKCSRLLQEPEEVMQEFLPFFRANGYWVVPGAVAVAADQLKKVQQAWRAATPTARRQWEAEKARPQPWVSATYFDLPRFIEIDSSFMDLIDNPRVLPLIKAAMGGEVVVDQIQGRTVPPNTDGYTTWHRDGAAHIALHPEHSLTIKAFTFPFDIAADQGPAAVVPGSHRVQFSAQDQSDRRYQRYVGGGKNPEIQGATQDSMPNSISLPVRAGTVVFYDNRIFHTSYPNTSTRDRCCLITSYKPLGGCGEGTNARGVSGQVFANASRLDRRGLLEGRGELRKLLGMETDYHTIAWHEANPTPDNM